MVLLLVFMQLTRDLFAIAKFLLSYACCGQTDRQTYGLENPAYTDRRSRRGKYKYNNNDEENDIENEFN